MSLRLSWPLTGKRHDRPGRLGSGQVEIALGLYAADALHLATAIHLGARWLVTDDGHLLSVPVQKYASASGVAVVNLAEVMAQLTA